MTNLPYTRFDDSSKVDYGILNAQDFGVPQSRSRFFLIGSKSKASVAIPTPKSLTKVTVREAIGDLPSLQNGANFLELPYSQISPSNYAMRLRGGLEFAKGHLVTKNSIQILERYKYVPQGGNWKNIPLRLMKNYKDRNRCHTGIYHRLKYDCPSIVIGNYRKNMVIHPEENRGLSVREAARLQSFSDRYEFAGSIGFQQQQVSDAVPPLLAQAVFSSLFLSIKSQLSDLIE